VGNARGRDGVEIPGTKAPRGMASGNGGEYKPCTRRAVPYQKGNSNPGVKGVRKEEGLKSAGEKKRKNGAVVGKRTQQVSS